MFCVKICSLEEKSHKVTAIIHRKLETTRGVNFMFQNCFWFDFVNFTTKKKMWLLLTWILLLKQNWLCNFQLDSNELCQINQYYHHFTNWFSFNNVCLVIFKSHDLWKGVNVYFLMRINFFFSNLKSFQ